MTRCTVNGIEPTNDETASVPTNEKKADGQYADHWTMCPTEIMEAGFVRPVRLKYRHVGLRSPKNLRDLTEEEHEQYDQYGYIKFEEYGPEQLPVTGKFYTKETLAKISNGCGTVTSMPQQIAETYAANPHYYGTTFCCGCNDYFRVEEFVWDGTDERVGS